LAAELRMLFYVVLSFGLATLSAEGKPLSQNIYESEKGITCETSSSSEISALQSQCAFHNKSVRLQNLDATSEHIIFSELAHREKDRLKCLSTEMSRVSSNPSILNSAVDQACKQISILEDTLINLEFFKDKAEAFQSLLSNTTVPLSAQDRQRNELRLSGYMQYYMLYEENIKNLRANDILLSSPNVFNSLSRAILKPSNLSGKSARESTCDFLKRTAHSNLKKDVQSIDKGLNQIEKNMKSSDWLQDTDFKAQLWKSPVRQGFFSSLKSNGVDFQKSTFCRMEGRYGYGYDRVQNLKEAALFVGGFIAPELKFLGKIGFEVMNSARILLPSAFQASKFPAWQLAKVVAHEENLLLSSTAVKVGQITGLAATSAMVIPNISQACKDKLDYVANHNSCSPASEEEYGKIFMARQEANSCSFVAGMGIISSGLAVLNIKGILATNLPAKTYKEIKESAQESLQLTKSTKESMLPAGGGSSGAPKIKFGVQTPQRIRFGIDSAEIPKASYPDLSALSRRAAGLDSKAKAKLMYDLHPTPRFKVGEKVVFNMEIKSGDDAFKLKGGPALTGQFQVGGAIEEIAEFTADGIPKSYWVRSLRDGKRVKVSADDTISMPANSLYENTITRNLASAGDKTDAYNLWYKGISNRITSPQFQNLADDEKIREIGKLIQDQIPYDMSTYQKGLCPVGVGGGTCAQHQDIGTALYRAAGFDIQQWHKWDRARTGYDHVYIEVAAKNGDRYIFDPWAGTIGTNAEQRSGVFKLKSGMPFPPTTRDSLQMNLPPAYLDLPGARIEPNGHYDTFKFDSFQTTQLPNSAKDTTRKIRFGTQPSPTGP
jgi:hypothetical protein